MTVKHEAPPEAPAREELRPSAGARTAEWIMGIVGAVATFLGLFIFFGGEDQYLGFGGDWSWRVGDIDAIWGYGFLIGGVLLLAGVVAMLVRERSRP